MYDTDAITFVLSIFALMSLIGPMQLFSSCHLQYQVRLSLDAWYTLYHVLQTLVFSLEPLQVCNSIFPGLC